ncbi:MAG: putative metal-binding motif-containing protein [Prolixibacteraceae bacterium]|nr:putative metal-binding motif-containing protein [Prolixibacteraceae bacterium]
MKNTKNGLQTLIKGTVMITFLAFGFISCNQEEFNSIDAENVQTIKSAKKTNGKIDVCHYSEKDDQWFVVSINESAWGEHSLHGDVWLDQDGDGYTAYNECGVGTMDDCDDTAPDVNPGATEIPYNGMDDDCNIDTPDDDLDGDGFNYEDDCDDTDPNVHPGAEEICGNGIDDNCNGSIDEDCGPKIFAIAYSDLNGVPGFQENSADVLISKLIDYNEDNDLSAGDKIIMGSYPLDCNATAFGEFGVKEHLIISVGEGSDQQQITVYLDYNQSIAYLNHPGEYQAYFEQQEIPILEYISSFFDTMNGSGGSVNVNSGSPSQPILPFNSPVFYPDCDFNADNDFLDVDIFIN